MAEKALKKLFLSLSVAAALAASTGSAFADGGDRTEQLEQRVAELEALVQQLLNQQQPAAPSTAEVEARAEAIAEDKVNEMFAAKQAEAEEKAKKNSYSFGGYIKADTIYSDYSGGSVASGSAGRDFYIPATVPVGTNGESYLDFHAKESRINFKSNHLLDNGAKIGTYLEMDFQLSGQGDERISNSYSPRMRHAFVTYNNWLVGQTWMTFYNVGTNPENLDFVGPSDGSLFGRQVQIRYTNGPWMFSAENPETTVTPYGGGGRIVADDNRVPDLVARYNMKGDWGIFSVSGMYRQLRYQDGASGINDSTTGWGLSVTGKHMLGRDDFRWMVSTGAGLGRYIGLNTSNGAVLDADGNLNAIDQTGAFVSYRHLWSDTWRSNLTLGYLAIDNDTNLTGMSATKEAKSVHINLIYSPQPKLDFGFEYLFAKRELESGADGDMNRFQFSAKYAY
ncbi:MAG: DcaP family trimeric outer membrane transporter [Lysobacterales bacterium]|jgi:hypothetical protein